MKVPIKVAAYAAGLAVVFAGALGVGRIAGPAPTPVGHEEGGHATSDTGHGSGGHEGAAVQEVPGGLQVSQEGYRLKPVSGTLATRALAPFAFRVLGPDGAPVTTYTPTHEKDLHLIVVRRDLSGFQHVHPRMGADGTWSIPLAVSAPGQYRVFADFQPADRDKGLTLGVDLPAPGDYQPTPLPAPQRTATVEGYTVNLDGDLVPGTDSKLTLSVSKDGRPVTDLQPYLGAYGHLVALRDGDLAYLHVHPDGSPGDGRTPAGPQITFYAQVPSTGAYRLYLDFQHAGAVRTAEFTAVAGGPAPSTAPSASAPTGAPTATPTPGHGADGHTHN
ncbi:MAG TPA: hypothetical protein VF462_02520 [Micromonosporaceae bacterium]